MDEKDFIKRLNGVYRAVVVDNRDPNNLRRVKVQAQPTGVQVSDWVWPMLSTKRPPAIGTGCWVMYVGGDPEYPVWIGEFGEQPQGMFSYGSWLSTADQTATLANTEYVMTVNATDYEEGINVIDSSKFTVKESGTYNVQFSAQVHHSTGGGGGAGDAMWIWPKKNGTTIADSAGRVNVSTGKYAIVSWNFIVKLEHGDYVQLAFSVETTNLRLEHEAASAPYPDVPSLILTMAQIA